MMRASSEQDVLLLPRKNPVDVDTSVGRRLFACVKLIRPKQWIKNAFVFAPLIFGRELFNLTSFLSAFEAFVAFSLTASAVYVFNDMTDVEADRLHPEKRLRPLAAGTLTQAHAIALLGGLLVLDAFSLWHMNGNFVAVLVVYFLVNLAYSLKLKKIVLLDVFTIAAGFMLRVMGGAFAIGVDVSSWIVLCSLFISLFLGFAKRRSELVQVPGAAMERKVLSLYRVDFLDQMLTIAAAGAVISYALYTVAPRTVAMFGTEKMIYTTVFVLYGIFRYLLLIHTTSTSENPTNAVTSDLTILGTGILWIIVCIALIYAGNRSFWPW